MAGKESYRMKKRQLEIDKFLKAVFIDTSIEVASEWKIIKRILNLNRLFLNGCPGISDFEYAEKLNALLNKLDGRPKK